jgi:hypothetical protein
VARRLRRGLIIAGLLAAAAFWPFSPAAAAPAPSADPGTVVTIHLAPGASVPPGRYGVVLRGGGREIVATASVVPATPPAPSSPAPASSSVTGLLAGALILLVIGVALYLLNVNVRVPMLRRREYEDLVRRLDTGAYRDAVTGLTRLEADLPGKLRTRARFFICYGLYQTAELDEAEHRLAALHREEPAEAEVAYLLAYLRVKRRDFDGAAPVLADLEKAGRLGVARARKLYGVVLFQQASQAVTDGRIEEAADLFERVERLGDFRDRVPADLRSRHAVIGARALLNHDLPAAREQFTELDRAARSEDLRVSAKLGLALTAWLENQPGTAEQIVRLLSQCLRLLQRDCPFTLAWPAPPGDDVAAQLEARAGAAELSAEDRDLRQTVRDLHLLRGLALMRLWSEGEVDAGRAASFVAACAERFACAVEAEPFFADPYLIVGLLRYHLAAGSDAGRGRALAELRAAHMLGARLPEVLQILRDADTQQRMRDDYTTFLHRLATGGTSGRVGGGMPSMGRFGRVPDRDSPADVDVTAASPPTVAELRQRADLLTARVRHLGGRLGPEFAAAADAAAKLAAASDALARQATAVADGEAALLALIGGQMLNDDQEASR